MKITFSIASLILYSVPILANVNVVATSTDIGAIVKEVGAGDVSLEVLAKGSQNLHALETKPSYMVKLNKADLFIANGLGLEAGWAAAVVRGARNPKINPGSSGNMEIGLLINPIEVPTAPVTRAEGDIHPDGNPHWYLDPVRVGQAAELIADRLAQIDSSKASEFKKRAKAFKDQLLEKEKGWRSRIKASGITKIITYHKTLNYFLDRFGIQGGGYLEPKPGIPPTAQHILSTIERVKSEKIRLILVEHFYDVSIAERISKDVPTAQVKSVAVAVEGMPGIQTNVELFEHIVKTIESAK